MKKLFIVAILILVSLVVANGQSFAITGPCSGCHTMHNSQNGGTMAYGTAAGAPAYQQLLIGDCLACHTVAGATAPTAPKVDTAVAGSITAAGSWSQASADSMRHGLNALNGAGYTQFGATDGVLTTAPGGTFTSSNLTCAGPQGCHGNGAATIPVGDLTGQAGINGFHHAGAATAGYRFLRVRGNNNPAVAGTPVGGIGSANWEMGGPNDTNHNIYQGKTYDAALGNSFSDFCNNCHPSFHAAGDAATDQGGSTGAFTRHPTDRNFANLANTGSITVDYTNNPFGFIDTAGLSTTANTNYVATDGNAVVGCMSCHRSHASGQPDLLRFNYANQVAGGGNTVGCLGCHVNQR